MADWGSKLTGLVCRYAGLLHVADDPDHSSPWDASIGEETMRRAIRLGLSLIPHALAVFSTLQLDPTVRHARHALDAIRAWCLDGEAVSRFSKRDLHQKVRRTTDAAALTLALELLCDHGYLRRADEQQQERGRQTELYEVNPAIRTRNTQKGSGGPQEGVSVDSVYVSARSEIESGDDGEEAIA
jgi:hypothetical protein